jgi:hypothetical protein
MTPQKFVLGVSTPLDQGNVPVLDLNEIVIRCMQGDKEVLGEGSDSTVNLVKVSQDLNAGRVVVKAYTGLKERAHHAGRAFDVIKQYKYDTEVAHRVLNENPNPLEQKITISGTECDVEHSIIPQGEAIQHSDGTVYSIGQEFVPGKTLLQFLHNPTIECAGTNKTIRLTSTEVNDLNKINLVLMGKFPTDARGRVSSSSLNVKPEINLKEQKVKFRITDLSDALHEDYGAVLMGLNVNLWK